MRNMMICASVMLAVFLGWPLAFGGKGGASIDSSSVEAHAATAAPPASVAPVQATVAAQPAAPQAESCYKRYQRQIKACTGPDSAACRQQNADHWDMCEATGFWPQ